jgi:hypothetical protein
MVLVYVVGEICFDSDSIEISLFWSHDGVIGFPIFFSLMGARLNALSNDVAPNLVATRTRDLSGVVKFGWPLLSWFEFALPLWALAFLYVLRLHLLVQCILWPNKWGRFELSISV